MVYTLLLFPATLSYFPSSGTSLNIGSTGVHVGTGSVAGEWVYIEYLD